MNRMAPINIGMDEFQTGANNRQGPPVPPSYNPYGSNNMRFADVGASPAAMQAGGGNSFANLMQMIQRMMMQQQGGGEDAGGGYLGGMQGMQGMGNGFSAGGNGGGGMPQIFGYLGNDMAPSGGFTGSHALSNDFGERGKMNYGGKR